MTKSLCKNRGKVSPTQEGLTKGDLKYWDNTSYKMLLNGARVGAKTMIGDTGTTRDNARVALTRSLGDGVLAYLVDSWTFIFFYT